MSEIIKITSPEQFQQFINDNGFIEIVTRGKNKRFKKFFNMILDLDSSKKISESATVLNNQNVLAQKVLEAVGKTTAISNKSLKVMGTLTKLQGVGLVLNGLNLGATCVGFAIMNEKLNQMSAKFSQELQQIQDDAKKRTAIQTEQNFREVLGKHSNMLDCRRRQKPFSEEQMWELVDKEYNVLTTLISIFKENLSSDKHTLFTMIFSLLSMFTVALKYYDEIYFTNNYKVLQGTNVIHPSHQTWMSLYTTLSSDWVVEYLQDYAMFEKDLTTREADIYWKQMLSVATDGKEEVNDNLTVLNKLKDMELVNMFREYTAQEEKEEFDNILDEVLNDNSGSEFKYAFDDLFDQVSNN